MYVPKNNCKKTGRDIEIEKKNAHYQFGVVNLSIDK